VILAAGQASRMGVIKQVLPYGLNTLVGSVVEVANRSVVDDVVVVTGFHSTEVAAAVGTRARIVHNPDAASGNMSSLVVGLDGVADVDGVVVLLSDMPHVTAETIDALVSGVVGTGSAAGLVAYADGEGHPIVLRSSTFEIVKTLTGPKALWRYLESLDAESLFVLDLDSARPIDINTDDDYDAAIRGLRGEMPVPD